MVMERKERGMGGDDVRGGDAILMKM